MSEIITDGTGKGYNAKVTADNRLKVDAITEPLSAERSREGQLFGCGSTNLPVDGAMDTAPILYIKNTSTSENMYIQKFIFGWNGGSTNYDRTAFALIKYQATPPTGAHTLAPDSIENISLSGASEAVSSGKALIYKWDGTGTDGMTGSTGGYFQIPNRIAKGDTQVPIEGKILLGPGDSLTFTVSPDETGEFLVSVLYYFVKINEERGDS